MRIESAMSAAFRGREGEIQCNAGALAMGADDGERGVDLRGALVHSLEAKVSLRRLGLGDGEAAAVVGDGEGEQRGFIAEIDVSLGGLGVTGDVGERLLSDAQELV